MNKVILVALLALVAGVAADNYAVLVAGSNGFSNYRHQSDVCHAYHTLLAKGFKAENIIVFSYNDVAKNRQNPFPGKLFNKPTQKNPGVDVNEGCVIDYQGADVTPVNYLAVLEANKSAVAKKGTGRVLESGPQDHVFLAFFDHGAPGLIAFPSQYLYAADLLKTFQTMFNNKQYARLVYYLEACESGSMFVNLPTNLNIYAVSAASPNESSWAAYCGNDAVVGGKNIGSCLGDLFSVSWLEDTDNHTDLSNYSLEAQFEVVKNLTTQSQVMQWGDVTFTAEPVGDYLTAETDSTTPSTKKAITSLLRGIFQFPNEPILANFAKQGLVDSRQATLQYLLNKFTAHPTSENLRELNTELQNVQFFQKKFEQISQQFNLVGASNDTETDFECYADAISHLENNCGKIPDAQLSNLKYLYELCKVHNYSNVNFGAYFQSLC